MINPNDPVYGTQFNDTEIEPVGYKILVEVPPSFEKQRYENGEVKIIIPDSVEERYQQAGVVARVMQIGSGAYASDRYPEGPWCRAGDWVILGPYTGVRVKCILGKPGCTYRFVNEDTIQGVVSDPGLVERN